ncbi:flagellar filament capping protein FliD [Blastococcus tunisiensis]|uniref:Flagellar hook-associated protein 2 n=1 Tax=Blastococcus tunisiensis TaxID=1798228 RepID=A0A1I2KTZ2_9ACTN|nr:flagellar filament capping protein FliD [Blastococcus sp. DSM 46838]SFF69789.1 flagellar hook-associated protein 2 [Blastococcus sp. DSM 46838]
MSMSVDGLISGMDTTTLIQQLLSAEAGPQTALKSKLSTTQTTASAYRTVNTTLAAVRAAAESLTAPENWSATKATSTAGSVAISATSTAPTGSLTFTVEKTARAHSVLNRNAGTWTSATSAYGASSITVLDKLGVAKTPAITITDTDADGTLSLTEAAAAINADTEHGLSATVVQLNDTEFALQVTSRTTGAAGQFGLSGTGTYTTPMLGRDAEIKVGEGTGAYTATSSTNTFTGLMPGATITVSQVETANPVTLSVSADPNAVAAKVQTLVDAVNSALGTIKTYTSNAKGSTAALKGDYSVSQLSGQLLDAVSYAVGTDGSPAQVGFSLTRDGKITFDKAAFVAALADDPALAQRMAGGTSTPASAGVDGLSGTADDVAAVTGIAGRLLDVAKAASDSTTGSLLKLAESQDSMGKDIQTRIEAWDLRLAKRKEMLTRQFSAMETALSALKNQSTWLAGQINSLPSYS